MQINWWTFAFQVINVLVLMWLLGRFMFRPVAKIVAEREAETNRILAAAEEAQAQAAAAEAAAQAEKDRIAAERIKILDAAKAEAEQQMRAMLDEAHKAAADIAAKARSDAARKADEDRKARRQKAVELAVVMARRLLGNLPQDGRVTGYPERLKEALLALDAEQREALSADPAALRLIAPRPLSDAELAAATDAIRAAIDGLPAPTVELDESLIAGLELSGRHGVTHNSLKYDLGRIEEALAKNDEL